MPHHPLVINSLNPNLAILKSISSTIDWFWHDAKIMSSNHREKTKWIKNPSSSLINRFCHHVDVMPMSCHWFVQPSSYLQPHLISIIFLNTPNTNVTEISCWCHPTSNIRLLVNQALIVLRVCLSSSQTSKLTVHVIRQYKRLICPIFFRSLTNNSYHETCLSHIGYI